MENQVKGLAMFLNSSIFFTPELISHLSPDSRAQSISWHQQIQTDSIIPFAVYRESSWFSPFLWQSTSFWPTSLGVHRASKAGCNSSNLESSSLKSWMHQSWGFKGLQNLIILSIGPACEMLSSAYLPGGNPPGLFASMRLFLWWVLCFYFRINSPPSSWTCNMRHRSIWSQNMERIHLYVGTGWRQCE